MPEPAVAPKPKEVTSVRVRVDDVSEIRKLLRLVAAHCGEYQGDVLLRLLRSEAERLAGTALAS
jgi:hypothetical protein